MDILPAVVCTSKQVSSPGPSRLPARLNYTLLRLTSPEVLIIDTCLSQAKGRFLLSVKTTYGIDTHMELTLRLWNRKIAWQGLPHSSSLPQKLISSLGVLPLNLFTFKGLEVHLLPWLFAGSMKGRSQMWQWCSTSWKRSHLTKSQRKTAESTQDYQDQAEADWRRIHLSLQQVPPSVLNPAQSSYSHHLPHTYTFPQELALPRRKATPGFRQVWHCSTNICFSGSRSWEANRPVSGADPTKPDLWTPMAYAGMRQGGVGRCQLVWGDYQIALHLLLAFKQVTPICSWIQQPITHCVGSK